MRLYTFKKFNEVNGTELVGHMGPAYGDTKLTNTTINKNDTTVIFSDLDGNFYTQDEYYQLYNNYLKEGGSPLEGFTKENIDKILTFIQNL